MPDRHTAVCKTVTLVHEKKEYKEYCQTIQKISLSSVLAQEINPEKHTRNDRFCVKWDLKPKHN